MKKPKLPCLLHGRFPFEAEVPVDETREPVLIETDAELDAFIERFGGLDNIWEA